MRKDDCPLVSVIIPTHNGGRYVKAAVESVNAQTFADHEILVVDDGSTDDTSEIVARLAGPVRRIPHEKALGPAAARNTGIREARGLYLALLDVDDRWHADKLACLLDLLEARPEIDVAFSDFVHVLQDGSPGPWRGGLREQIRARGMELEQVSAQGYVFTRPVVSELICYSSFMHPSTVVFRRQAIERAGYFDERVRGVEDLQMWIRFAYHCRIGYVDRVLAEVEQRPDSLGHNRLTMCENTVGMLQRLSEYVPNLSAADLASIERRCAAAHRSLGWLYFDRGDGARARQHYQAALACEFQVSTLGLWFKTCLPPAMVRSARRVKELVGGGTRG